MKYIALFVIAIISFSCTSSINQETVNYENETILVGEVNWNGLTKLPYSTWFDPNYLDYNVDTATLNTAHLQLSEVDIIVFLGTWCSDSQLEVPQFYKILDYLHYDVGSMHVIALEKLENKQMVSPEHEEEDYGITHVPTFIFKRNDKEIGRITEYPNVTLEKDMVVILMKERI